jgi:uncharacterized membrane protein YoaK (UPF0700 family)
MIQPRSSSMSYGRSSPDLPSSRSRALRRARRLAQQKRQRRVRIRERRALHSQAPRADRASGLSGREAASRTQSSTVRAPRALRSPSDAWTQAALAAVAGSVDAAGWVCLAGLLPSHLTASLVMLAGPAGRDPSEVGARLLMLPIFALTVALLKLAARALAVRRLPVLQTLQTLLSATLALFCTVGSLWSDAPADEPRRLLIVGGLGVIAMAVQNTIMRLCLPQHGPTTVMTGNLTQLVLACVDRAARPLPRAGQRTPRRRARVARPALRASLAGAGLPLLGFVLGVLSCGALASRHGLASLALPVLLSVLVTAHSWRQLRRAPPVVAARARMRPVDGVSLRVSLAARGAP